jgi:hypothetical protein
MFAEHALKSLCVLNIFYMPSLKSRAAQAFKGNGVE